LKFYLKYPVLIVSPALSFSSKSYDANGKSFGIMYLGFCSKRAVIDVESCEGTLSLSYLDDYLPVKISSDVEYWVRIEVIAKSRNVPILVLLRELRAMDQLNLEEYLKPVKTFSTKRHLIGFMVF
jgi:hypothetical protein